MSLQNTNMETGNDIESPHQSDSLNNPIYLASLIDKYVTVVLIQDYSYSGFVNNIDPESKSIILSTPKEDIYQSILIPGHAILGISKEFTTLSPPARRVIPELEIEQLRLKRRRIIAWFQKNLLPVTEKEDVIDLGSVSILPPYGVSEVFTNNPVVSSQIQKLILSMPEDFQC